MCTNPIARALAACVVSAVVAVSPVLWGCGERSTTPLERYRETLNPHEAVDAAMGGKTLRGTPVTPRTEECFPAEPRDLFWEMDWVFGKDGQFGPLDFDEDGDDAVDDTERDANGLTERDAIRGRNTWLVWGGGNEAFWGWLQEEGYGLQDFLILLDSRERKNRFKTAGLINQPGFETSRKPLLGLYLDKAKDDGSAILLPRGAQREVGVPYGSDYYRRLYEEPERFDGRGRELAKPVRRPSIPKTKPHENTELFEPWVRGTLDDGVPFAEYAPDLVRSRLAQDGLDPDIYGYPSGIFGLRLFLNPDFFASTDGATRAREYWKERVEDTKGRYYTDPEIHADPKLIRPFRVSMSCGFCHVGPHPLNPPVDPENPEWKNLSGIIGDQYWDPQPANGNLLRRTHFLHHFLKSQAPGTIDTSLVSTDQINNTNVINAVFDVPARLERARRKPRETMSRENRLLPSIEEPGNTGDQRIFPMVLFPGEDSIGVFGALARVPLNIGVFSEQWARSDNPIIGFTPQRPFSIEIGRSNSVFWRVNEKYRVGYMAKFFTLGASGKVSKSTEPMKLKHAPGGRAALPPDQAGNRAHGRDVFIDHCAICHSSKQPEGFHLLFERAMPGGWDKAAVPLASARHVYTLPMEYGHWEDFKKSPAYADYKAALRTVPDVAAPAPGDLDGRDWFLENNFLSNELRIPVTLVGTYSGRAMATNAMRGNVWNDYSSETFKDLLSVGDIRFYNPFAGRAVDGFDTNDVYDDGREKGGPGYYRPASLISLWATAPYLHNNALGIYTQDPSVGGRLRAFDDGIRKLLWKECRKHNDKPNCSGDVAFAHPGDLRGRNVAAADEDPGYIYRLPVDTRVKFAAGFIRPLVEGILVGNYGRTIGPILLSILTTWLWLVLVTVFAIGAIWGSSRHAGTLLVVLALVLAVPLAVTAIGSVGGAVSGALMMIGAFLLMYYPAGWLWLAVAVLGLVGLALLLARWEARWSSRVLFGTLAIVTLVVGIRVHGFIGGRRGDLDVGPIPRGVPVNLLMNIDPEKAVRMPAALIGLARAVAQINREGLSGDRAYDVFAKTAGPGLIAASKVPDMVLDRGHWFGEALTDDEKKALIAFLKTL